MTFTSSSQPNNNSSDANFRAWGQWVSDTLTSFGFTKTSDTGQINWTTVTKPASNVSQGYEIRQFTDSLAGSSPIVFKIEYGGNLNGSGTVPDVWVTLGTGSNGSGTITGTTSARTQTSSSTGGITAATNAPIYAWTDGSAFGFMLFPSADATFGGIFFGIERVRNADGTANAGGASLYIAMGGSTAATQATISTSGTAYTTSSGWSAPVMSTSTATFTWSGSTYPGPIFSGISTRYFAPSQMLVALGKSDVIVGTTFTVSHYGVSRTFISAGNFGWQSIVAAMGANSSFAMRAD